MGRSPCSEPGWLEDQAGLPVTVMICEHGVLAYFLIVGVSTISNNGGWGVLVNSGSHAVVASNGIDANGRGGVTVSQNSAVVLSGDLGFLNAPNDTSLSNAGFGVACSQNSSIDGRLGTLSGVDGVKSIDISCIDASSP